MEQREEYNVIWIDDECKEKEGFAPGFIKRCKLRFNIHLFPFELETDGLTILENDTEHYDAVILDAKGWADEKYVVTTTKGMYAAIRRIERLAYKKVLPYYVLTAQEDLLKSQDFKDSIGNSKIFYKYSPNDIENLLKNIQAEVKANRRNQVKLYYSDALSRITALNPKSAEIVLDILDAMHHPYRYPSFRAILYYNPLRKILEYNFRAAHKVKLIPDECFMNEVNLSQCCHYLSGNEAAHLGVRYGGKGMRIVPEHIQSMMFSILNIGNINSHSSELPDEDVSRLELYLANNVFDSKYIISCMALQICEITLWMSQYIENHSVIEDNENLCKTFGKVIQSEKYKDICFIESGRKNWEHKFCIAASFAERKKLIGKKVVVLDYSDNTGESVSDFPYFAKVEPLER